MMLPCRPAGQKLTEKHIISRAGADASPGRKKIDGTTYVFDKNGVLLSEKES